MKHALLTSGLVALASVLLFPASLQAQCLLFEQKLIGNDIGVSDGFPTTFDADGDVVVATAYYQQNYTGAAYVFRRNGESWSQEQKLQASDKAEGDYFGNAAAIDGNVIVVGAHVEDTGGRWAGAAYVFRYNGSQWVEEQRLKPAVPQQEARFGSAVAIEGNVIVVGSVYHDNYYTDAGTAYVFRYNGSTWVQEAQLFPSLYRQDATFGTSVSMSGSAICVGSLFGYSGQLRSGRVFVFRYNGSSWPEEQALTASDAADSDFFGSAVAIHGNRLIAGAYGDDDRGAYSGSAYLFRHDGNQWVQEQKLTSPTGQTFDYFGLGVDLHGDVAVASASSDDEKADGAGAVFEYHHDGNNWVQRDKLFAIDAGQYGSFGIRIVLTADQLVATGYSNSQGTAYVLRRTGFGLATYPPSVAAGGTLIFEHCGGQPFGGFLLAAVGVNAVPVFVPILISSYDAQGSMGFSTAVPGGLTGLGVTFQAFGTAASGFVLASDTERVTFQ